ncbi:hypothetical protein GI374_13000 [Paracoccus sp. S-4012]|uniref:hypothetical protein n=1 Tax=Paracoccus sp. S-4012 TaxID=2665648 RepID=UPI0012B0B850|nr:hypothetical protein [Paracoccus sp. S-4012]MRX51342.1 hypothetical protein [Paracoccus sp. S-4012]
MKQARDVRQITAAFGHHPLCNQVLGRRATLANETCIANGDFPHLRAFYAGEV